MKRRDFHSTCVQGLASLFAITPRAVVAERLSPATRTERKSLAICFEQLRLRQNGDGSFRVAAQPGLDWRENYFSLEACCALLASGDAGDLGRVVRYLEYYAGLNAEPFGVPGNLDLSRGERVEKPFDSIDAVAGLYLYVVAKTSARASLPQQVDQSAYRSLRAIDDVINHKEKITRLANSPHRFSNGALTNGLPINTGSAVQHFLMDALETYFGLREAVNFFAKRRDKQRASRSRELANGIVRGLKRFKGETHYAHVVMNGNDAQFFDGRNTKGLANLYALSYLKPKYAGLWAQLNREFVPDDVNAAQAPSERWLIAAYAAAPAEVPQWQNRVAANAISFNNSTYLDRLAITALALINGNARFPTVVLT